MRENDININLYPRNAGNGHYTEIIKKYKKEFNTNKKSNFIIWVDKDIYIRNENKNMDRYRLKPKNIPDFTFNFCNFEDFITLHLEYKLINCWETICKNKNHFENPMTSDQYEILFIENIINNYEKGIFPFNEINYNMLINAIDNNNNKSIKFKSDFLTFLENIIKRP